MEAIMASTNRVLQVATDTDLNPDSLGRLQRVLASARAVCLFNPTFGGWLTGALDEFVDKLNIVIRNVDALTARLQSARRLASTTTRRHRRHVASAAHLAGLHGDDLFRALMALQLTATAPPEVCLEAALAAQRLIVHDRLDKFVQFYGKVFFEGNTTTRATYLDNIRAFVDHEHTLEKFVQEHVDLANAATAARESRPRPPTTGARPTN